MGEYRMNTLRSRDDGVQRILDETVYKMGQNEDVFCNYLMHFERQRGLSQRNKLLACFPKILVKCQVMKEDEHKMNVMAESCLGRFKAYRNYLAHLKNENTFRVWFTLTDVRIVYNRWKWWMGKNEYNKQ